MADGVLADDLGLDEAIVRSSFAQRIPVTEEIERHPNVIVLLRCIPLLDNDSVSGGLLLMRDVSAAK